MPATSIGVNAGPCLLESSYSKTYLFRKKQIEKVQSTSSYVLQEMVITELKKKL